MKTKQLFCMILTMILTAAFLIPPVSAKSTAIPFPDIADWYAGKDYLERSGNAVPMNVTFRQDYSTNETNIPRVKSWITSYIFDCLESEWDFQLDGEHHDSKDSEQWGYYWLNYQENNSAKKFKMKDQSGGV